jgi:hypothetical protein
MHAEWVDGLVLRPLMDAGYTGWRDGHRVGIVRYVDGELRVEAGDLRTRTALVERMTADLRAAGLMRERETFPPAQPLDQDTQSAA